MWQARRTEPCALALPHPAALHTFLIQHQHHKPPSTPLSPLLQEDPFNRASRAHSDLANVARGWPSVASHDSRQSELRARSTASMKRRSSLTERAAAKAVAGVDGKVVEEP